MKKQSLSASLVKKTYLTLLSFSLVASLNITAQAQTDWVEQKEAGEINWQDAYIEAQGQGTARYMGNRIQEELMAKQAARTTALSRLLALSEGVRVTGLTTLGAQSMGDTRAATRIKGTVRGAKTISEEVSWHKDASSRRGEVPFAEVTLRLCIDPRCTSSETHLSTLAVTDNKAAQTEHRAVQTSDPISAVIIDLEQALFLPALSPEIIDEKENLLYGAEMVSADVAHEKGLVHYVKSVKEAKKMPLAGPAPLVISALKISPDNRIILSEKDSALLKNNPALETARVIVALD